MNPFFLALCSLFVFLPSAYALDGKTPATATWRDLSTPHFLAPQKGAIYYSFGTKNGAKVHVVVTNYKSKNWKFYPILNDITKPTSQTAKANDASAATNAGFFNLSDGQSTSYITIQGKLVADPHANKALLHNPKLAPYMEAIYNRSELRFLQDKSGTSVIDICPHNKSVPADLTLTDSIQAGPQLLPELTDKKEAFVRKDPDGKLFDSISVYKPAARTAFGITNDGYAIMICVAGTGQDPESSGITLPELAELCKSLGCVTAINFDGGASSSMFIKEASADANSQPLEQTVCAKNPETRVKSVLLLKPSSKDLY